MPTTVVNVKTDAYEVFIGRPSLWGNPFTVQTWGREGAIAKYREEFKELIKIEAFRDALQALKDRKLGCFCKPEACHGDVIAEYLNEQDRFEESEAGRPDGNSQLGSS